MPTETIKSLDQLKSREKAFVVALIGGRSLQNRLISMGLNVGSPVEVIRPANGNSGPALVAAGDARIAIGRGMAAKIMVAVGDV